MAEQPRTPSGDKPIADADLLFRDPDPKPAAAAAKPAGPSAGAAETFELAGEMPTTGEADVAARPVAAPRAERRAKVSAEPEARVDEVWTRQAEWLPTLIVLAIVGFAVLLLAYMSFSVENLALPLLILLVGGAAFVVLSYPILITMERPVRMTPEQAIKDYYSALSHHFPHFRRMWLLLSTPARTSGAYGSFEGFKAYWKARLESLRGGRAGKLTPLSFEIADYKAEQSSGKVAVEAKYTVVVHLRGRRGDGPVASIRTRTWTVKGPDNMWYLNDGTLSLEEGPR